MTIVWRTWFFGSLAKKDCYIQKGDIPHRKIMVEKIYHFIRFNLCKESHITKLSPTEHDQHDYR